MMTVEGIPFTHLFLNPSGQEAGWDSLHVRRAILRGTRIGDRVDTTQLVELLHCGPKEVIANMRALVAYGYFERCATHRPIVWRRVG